MNKFEVGKSYGSYDCCVDPITVLSRTAKSIKVTNGMNEWRMFIGYDSEGNEIVADSKVSKKWRPMFTYSSRFEEASHGC